MKVIYNDERGEVKYDDIYQMFFENLKNRKVDFNLLSKMYVDYLQLEEMKYKKQVSEADIPLAEIFENSKHNTVENRKCYIARYLVKYGRFKGTPFYNELLDFVKEKNINLDQSYYIDLFNK